MNICLDDGCVYAEFAARDGPLFDCHLHDACMQLFDDTRTQLARQTAHRFVIGHFAANAGGLAIHQIGPHLARQIRKAPVAKMLQQQRSREDFRGGGGTAARLPFLAALGQFPLNNQQQRLVLQCLVGMAHPGLLQITHRFGDEPVGETLLQAARGNHMVIAALFLLLPWP